MVTCSELGTIVTTQENSFLVWGSRPAIKSPLHTLLALSDHTPYKDGKMAASVKRREGEGRHLLSVTFDIGSPEPSPDPPSGSRERVHRSSSLNLSNTPHNMTLCPEANQYMKMLTQLLQLQEPSHGKMSRMETGGVVMGGARRGPSVSSEAGLGGVEKEGIILEPTSVDLVGRCGLLSELSAQGLQQAKLEGVSNYAGNVLILIEAKVPEEKGEGQRLLRVSPPQQPLLMMSKRLMERRHWTK